MASRTPKHMPRCSARRTCMIGFLFSVDRQGRSGEPSWAFRAARLAAPTVNRPWIIQLTPCSGAVPAAALLHDGFQMIEIARESLAAGAGELAARLWPAADELLVDGDVALLFQLLQMNAE